jgi:GxxExxY protein
MRVFEPLDPETEGIAKAIVDSAFKVHRTLGPGLLESVYELCLAHELRRRGVQLEAQVKLPIVYEGLTIDAGLRLDLIVERRIIVEVKAVEKMHPVFDAQLLTYIKLTRLRLGLLINFNVPLIRDGIKRILL